MATKRNIDLRAAMLVADVRHYEVAEKIGIADESFSRWMRHEMPPEKKKQILEIIDQIIAERATP